MKCENVQRQLSAYSDNALSPAEARALERHLANCAACDAQRARLQALKALLALKRHERPDTIYLDGMREEFHRRLVAQRSARRAARWVFFDTVGLQHWWERTRRVFRSHPLLALRYGLASAAVVALMVNAMILMVVFKGRHSSALGPADDGTAISPTYMLERMPSATSADSIPF
jgi:anti-sigma factor RsiW